MEILQQIYAFEEIPAVRSNSNLLKYEFSWPLKTYDVRRKHTDTELADFYCFTVVKFTHGRRHELYLTLLKGHDECISCPNHNSLLEFHKQFQ